MISTWATRLVVGVGIVCLIVSMVFATRIIRADWAYFNAQKAVAYFGDNTASIAVDQRDTAHIVVADTAINKAIQLSPDNPKYLTLAAQINSWKGYLENSQQQQNQQQHSQTQIDYDNTSIDLIRKAIDLAPANPRNWAMLAEYKTKVGQRDQEWHKAKEKALELGGADPKLVERMLSL